MVVAFARRRVHHLNGLLTWKKQVGQKKGTDSEASGGGMTV